MARAISNSFTMASSEDYEFFGFDKNPKALERASRLKPLKSLETLRLSESDFVFVCVEPGQISALASEVKEVLGAACLVSIAAGFRLAGLEKEFGSRAILRCMPNMPIQVGKGASFICGNSAVSSGQTSQLISLLSSSSKVWEVDEKFFDLITVLSGSGPAILYTFVKSMAAAGASQGLDESLSEAIVRQVFLGSSALLELKEGRSVSECIAEIATSGGTTEAAIQALEDLGLGQVVNESVERACQHAVELAK